MYPKNEVQVDQEKKRSCRKYIMLSLMEKVLEDMELWDNEEKEQEITFYRRTASLLDVLFKNTDVMLTDGETASYSSKTALEMNKCIFGNADSPITTTYPRKIDLLLKYDRDERVELSSNEWKRACISPSIALSQQINNLKVNATIINKNQSVYSSTFNQSLAIDFVGLTGYGYILEKLNDVFFAKTICLLILPKDFDTFSAFKNTLNFFFTLKEFYCQKTIELKEIVSTRRALSRISSIVNVSCEEDASAKTNLIFFKQSRKRKRPDSKDEDEEAA
ncbi:uncharacterized protein BX663DRAFT_79676 [Cokeromyces recurvatus]|uniref:uncharacterized protein n=1 Tax=Cokeromyces recurvatus TaxID=90255 RepID=UPI00221F469D|nr:uncharacterized protein BX663DRAFT_79676 [Cokeromyces recurvatus]KAI7902040.1 hypothetical protein BX663DRAFT_79676 [Cokeromyces recurvatus]